MIRQHDANTFETAKGLTITVRRMMPDDAPYLVDLFENMSEQSRYQRFYQTLDKPDIDLVWTEAEQIAHSVAVNSFGLLAFANLPERRQTPVGGARFVKTAADEAEVAVSVRDDYQNLGIGTLLMRLLIDEARRQGLRRLTGIVLNDNYAVWGLLKNLELPFAREQDGNATNISLLLEPVNEDSTEPDLVGQ